VSIVRKKLAAVRCDVVVVVIVLTSTMCRLDGGVCSAPSWRDLFLRQLSMFACVCMCVRARM
jgi:hypothetical protein